jgi:hypothetical protein
MNNNNGKNEIPIRTGKDVLNKHVEAVPGHRRILDGCSWLVSASHLDQDTNNFQARSTASEIFIQTKLFPLIESRSQIHEAILVDLLVDFKRSRIDLDVDFEISQVSANLLNRFQCHLMDDTDIISDSLQRELDLFVLIADLDFHHIDDVVRNRLKSE